MKLFAVDRTVDRFQTDETLGIRMQAMLVKDEAKEVDGGPVDLRLVLVDDQLVALKNLQHMFKFSIMITLCSSTNDMQCHPDMLEHLESG